MNPPKKSPRPEVTENRPGHRLSLMNRGKIVALGAPNELKSAAGKASMEEVFVAMIEEEERRAS